MVASFLERSMIFLLVELEETLTASLDASYAEFVSLKLKVEGGIKYRVCKLALFLGPACMMTLPRVNGIAKATLPIF